MHRNRTVILTFVFLIPFISGASHDTFNYPIAPANQEIYYGNQYERIPRQNDPETTTQHYHGQDGKYDSNNDGTGWDIRLSVPGEPERDYPILNTIPITSFNCNNKRQGYYADTQTRCQVFRVCANTAINGFFSFLCPNGTLFNQEYLVCDWWMNVKCVDTERYLNTNSRIIIKSGEKMVADIKNMIMFPMKNPYTDYFPPMQSTVQTYNPPRDMISAIQNGLNGNDVTGLYKLPGPPFGSSLNVGFNKAGSLLSTTKTSENSESNFKKVEDQTKASNFFAPQNFGGLASYDKNTQAIKITKQQFTYPSEYDKEITLTVPKLPLPHPFVVRLPINVPAIDTDGFSVSSKISKNTNHEQDAKKSYFNNNTSYIQSKISIPKSVPIIVLFLQPPREPSSYSTPQTSNSFQSNLSNHRLNNYDSTKDSSSIVEQKNSSHNIHQYQASIQNNTSSSNSYYTTNQSMLIKNHRTDDSINQNTDKTEAFRGNIKYASKIGEDSTSSKNELKSSFIDSSKDNNLQNVNTASFNINAITNKEGENNNGLVTLISAHVIPGGDVNKQKVFKICIPKNVLSYLMHIHNSTKTAIESNFQNELSALTNIKNNTNTTIHIESQPLLRKIMEKIFSKHHYLNQQVPISTGEELYLKQKELKSQNSKQNFGIFNSNIELSKTFNKVSNYTSNSSFGQQQFSQNVSQQVYPEYVLQIPDLNSLTVPTINTFQLKEITQGNNKWSNNGVDTKNNIFYNANQESDVKTNSNHFNGNQQVINHSQGAGFNSFVADQIRKENNQLLVKEQITNNQNNNIVANSEFYFKQKQNSNPKYNSQYSIQNTKNTQGFDENNNKINQNELLQYNIKAFKNVSDTNHEQHFHAEKTINHFINPSPPSIADQNVPNQGNLNQNYNNRYSQSYNDQKNSDKYNQNYASVMQNQNLVHHNFQNSDVNTQQQYSRNEANSQSSGQRATNHLNPVQSLYTVSAMDTTNPPQPTIQSYYSTLSSYTENSNSQDKNNYENKVFAYQTTGAIKNQNSQNTQTVENRYLGNQDYRPSNYGYENSRQTDTSRLINQNGNSAYQEGSLSNMYTSHHNEQSANDQIHTMNQKIIHQQPPNYQNNGQHLIIRSEFQNYNPSNGNQNSEINVQPHDDNYYTTVEVVPALGFALNSEQERKTYYSALMNRYKYDNQYESPQRQEMMTYPGTSEASETAQMKNSQDSIYRASQYQNFAARTMDYNRYQTSPETNKYIPPRRLVHGQIIAHTMPQITDNMKQQSLPLEDFGYPRERPKIAFTY